MKFAKVAKMKKMGVEGGVFFCYTLRKIGYLFMQD